MDLVAINGPWQTITFLNFYLSENRIINENSIEIIFYDIDLELESYCKKILKEFNFQKRTYSLALLEELVQFDFNNIWISKLFSKNPKIILQKLNKPGIVLFEEGLHSYVPTRLFSTMEILKTKQKVPRLFNDLLLYLLNKNEVALRPIYDHLVLPSHFFRCSKKCLLLDIFEGSNDTIVRNEKLPEILDKTKDVFAKDLFLPFHNETGRKKIMIIGQYFSYLNVLDPRDEFYVYKQIINYYMNMGYLVYWKSHPRMAHFEQELVNEFTEERFITINTKLPAEFYSYLYPDIDFIGITSSSLLYKSLLFNGKSYQVAQSLIDKINPYSVYAEDFRIMFRTISKIIPTNKNIELN